MKRVETKKGLEKLLQRLNEVKNQVESEEWNYWNLCVEGCIKEQLALDEIDYENSPKWFRKLWVGLK